MVVVVVTLGGDEGGQETAAGGGENQELIEHGLDLRLGGVAPDGATEEEIEIAAEANGIKVVIGVKGWIFNGGQGEIALGMESYTLGQDSLEAGGQHGFVGFEAVIAVSIQEMEQPVAAAEGAATDFQDD